MKLILYIRKRVAAEVELQDLGLKLPLEPRVKMREEYIKWEVEKLKTQYAKAIENYSWEIVLEVESNMNIKETFLEKYLKAG